MILSRKWEASPCSLDRAAAASHKLDQNYLLTQFILQTLGISFLMRTPYWQSHRQLVEFFETLNWYIF